MAAGISRVRNEEIFAARHKRLHWLFSNDLIYEITHRILRVPVLIASPMDFIVFYPPNQNDVNIRRWLSASDERDQKANSFDFDRGSGSNDCGG